MCYTLKMRLLTFHEVFFIGQVWCDDKWFTLKATYYGSSLRIKISKRIEGKNIYYNFSQIL